MCASTLILRSLIFCLWVAYQSVHIHAYTSAKVHHFSQQDDLLAITEFIEELKLLSMRRKPCKPVDFGELYGAHKLCPLFESHVRHFDCHFLSFGVEKDYSFDVALHERMNCTGVAFDPTVNLQENLAPGVKFMKRGANSPARIPDAKYTSVPKFRLDYGHPLYALKMDCEGCEYSLAQDILRDDPHFFLAVLQFNVEFHIPKSFASTDEDVYNLGRLLRLIHLSGMKLIHVDSGQCGPQDQVLGCHDMLKKLNFPCEPGCRSYLFAHNYQTLRDWKEIYANAHT